MTTTVIWVLVLLSAPRGTPPTLEPFTTQTTCEAARETRTTWARAGWCVPMIGDPK